jgi:hypothetical protein
MRFTASPTTCGSMASKDRVVRIQLLRLLFDQHGVQEDLDQDVAQETGTKASSSARHRGGPTKLQAEFREGSCLMEPAIVVQMLQDARQQSPHSGDLDLPDNGSACRLRIRIRRSTTLSQSGTAVPARK